MTVDYLIVSDYFEPHPRPPCSFCDFYVECRSEDDGCKMDDISHFMVKMSFER